MEDIENSVSKGKIFVIEEENETYIKVKWKGPDLDGEEFKLIIAFDFEIKSVVITVYGG
ncbi:MAG: hypothetical protein ACOYL6_11565 [Bacteriovoracaceae bacterium]